MNRAAKRVIERALVGGGIARLARTRLPPGSSLVLAYHDIVPTGQSAGGDASLHLPQRQFGRQLDVLRATHEVVPLEALLHDTPSHRPRVAITFDDAYAGALEAGIAELKARELPATIFVAPGLLNEVPWWDLLATPDGEVPPAVRNHALWQLSGERGPVLSWAAPRAALGDSGRADNLRIGTLTQLLEAAAVPGITLGSHSWSHANLSSLPPVALERELRQPLEWLRARFDCVVPVLSYPYGLSSAAVEQAAERAGYHASFRVDGGWISRLSDASAQALPRYNVPAGLSLDGFRLRLAGIGTGS